MKDGRHDAALDELAPELGGGPLVDGHFRARARGFPDTFAVLGHVLLMREIGERAIDRFLLSCFSAFDRIVEKTGPVALNEPQCGLLNKLTRCGVDGARTCRGARWETEQHGRKKVVKSLGCRFLASVGGALVPGGHHLDAVCKRVCTLLGYGLLGLHTICSVSNFKVDNIFVE